VTVIRRDYLLDRWVAIAARRASRPSDFARPHKARLPATCVFCPGHEHLTPRAVLLYLTDGRGGVSKARDTRTRRIRGWSIRCFPNLYPALSPRSRLVERRSSVLHVSRPGKGYHEIVVESPDHGEHPGVARLGQLKLVLRGYLDRLSALSNEPSVRYVSIFRNHGLEGGASLSHAHSQIIGTPLVPKTIEDELRVSRAFWKKRNACAYCRLVSIERRSPRLIHENDYFVAIAPWASIFPFEFWIVPKRHSPSLSSIRADEIGSLAVTMRATLGSLAAALGDPPYNYGFHTSPSVGRHHYYHWHLEVYPRLSRLAGFELSTGMYINTLLPEAAARLLRARVKEQIRKLGD
jgi:UDPglucose--hexose-1-phosphate uridylyltransferase